MAFQEGLDIEIRTCTYDKNGRCINLHPHIQDNPNLLVNYYAPMMNVLRLNIIDKMELEQDMRIVWGGDFNN